MTHQSDTSSFRDRAQKDTFTTRLLRESKAVAAWSIDRQADAIAPQMPDEGARSATDDSVEPRALGELAYLRRGARLGKGEIYLLRDAVVSLSIEMDCHVALARDGDMAGLHQLLLPAHPELVATVVRQGHAVRIQRERLRRAMQKQRGTLSAPAGICVSNECGECVGSSEHYSADRRATRCPLVGPLCDGQPRSRYRNHSPRACHAAHR